MILSSFLFMVGILTVVQMKTLPGIWLMFSAVLALILPLPARALKYAKLWRWYSLGLVISLIHASFIKPDSGTRISPRTLWASIQIASLVKTYQNGNEQLCVFYARLVRTTRPRVIKRGLLRVRWKTRCNQLRPAQTWRLKLRVKSIVGYASLGAFESETWAYTHNIAANASVVIVPGNRYIATSAHDFRLTRWRDQLSTQLQQRINNMQTFSLVAALTLGDRRFLNAHQWELFRQTGVSHLVAISGLHVSLIAYLGFILTRRLGIYFTFLRLYRSNYRLAIVIGLLAAIGYAVLAGFSLPTQRALLMILIFAGLELFARPQSLWFKLCASAVLLLVFDPFAILTASFLLSFYAVVCLFVLQHRYRGGSFRQLVLWHSALALMLFPLSAYLFAQTAWITPVANLISIPLFALIVVPISLLGLLFLGWLPNVAHGIFTGLDYLIDGWYWCLSQLASLNITTPTFILNHGFGLLSCLLGVTLILFAPSFRFVYCGLLCCLPGFINNEAPIANQQFRVTLFDVGQGTSVLIETRSHRLLYDTGGAFAGYGSVARRVLLPFFKRTRIQHLDRIVVSHLDQDHAGGVNDVLFALTRLPEWVMTSDPIELPVAMTTCRRGQHWWWDGVLFEIIHPSYPRQEHSRNNRSCVLKVSVGRYAILLTGDIHRQVEQRLVYRHQRDRKLNANLLLVPHHGSKSSSSESFIQAVAPNYALVSRGFANRFGFPRPIILQRYQSHSVKIIDTAKDGTVQFLIDQIRGVKLLSRWRQKHRHFWQPVQH